MWFNTRIRSVLRQSATVFLPPFLLLSAVSLSVVALLSLRTGVTGRGDAWTVAFVFLLAGGLSWHFLRSGQQTKALARRISQAVFPVLLAGAALISYFHSDLYGYVAPFVTSALIALSVLLFPPARTSAQSVPAEHARMDRRIFAALAVAIIVLGVSLCAYKAYSTPTISVDEAHSSISASSILTRHLPYFPNTQVVYSRSWADLYSIAASYKLFGFSAFSARIPSVIAYGLTIVLFFLTLRRIAPRYVTLGALLIFATNPWILFYGSYARMYIFILLFSTLFSYLLVRYLQTKEKVVLYVLLPLTIVLGLLSERTFLLFVPPYGLLVLFSFPRTWSFWKKVLLFGIIPGIVAMLAALSIWYQAIFAFVSQYVIGFNNGANPLENAHVQYVPLDWLSHFGFPTVLLLIATVVIVLRGNLASRIVLAIFWFGEVLVDVFIYSNFPARRFNYTFILVELYALVLVWGTMTLLRGANRWLRYAFVLAIGIASLYLSFGLPAFPAYADFSTIRMVPPGSIILGYPTSPIVFYNIKYDLHDVVRPFITDTVEMGKYTQNGTEIYSGGPYVTGVKGLNELRQKHDVYLFFEKTRVDFLNKRTNEYIFTTCIPINQAVASATAQLIQQKYQPTDSDYDTRNTMLILTCPKLPL